MHTSAENSLPKTLDICQDHKFLHKLLSRENSIGSSTRVYYTGISSSIPFTWETQPGTPRRFEVPKCPNVGLVLTPPPAYQIGGVSRGKGSSKSSKLFNYIFCLGTSKDADSDSNNYSIPRTTLTFVESSISSYSSSFSGKRRSMSSSCSGSGSVSSFDDKVADVGGEILATQKLSGPSRMTVSLLGRQGQNGGAVAKGVRYGA